MLSQNTQLDGFNGLGGNMQESGLDDEWKVSEGRMPDDGFYGMASPASREGDIVGDIQCESKKSPPEGIRHFF